MAVKTLLTVEEFDRLPDEERRLYELVRGELVPVFEAGMTAARYGHNYVRDTIVEELRQYARRRNAGRAVAEQDFRLTPETVRRPDAAFLRAERVARIDPETSIIDGAPDLAVEVVSDSDSAEALERKTDEHRAAGCEAVWLVYWRLKKIYVHTADGVREFRDDDALTGAPLLPGFSVPLSRIFEL